MSISKRASHRERKILIGRCKQYFSSENLKLEERLDQVAEILAAIIIRMEQEKWEEKHLPDERTQARKIQKEEQFREEGL